MFNRNAANYFNPYQPIQPTMNPYQNGFYPPYMAAQNGQVPMPAQEPPISDIRFLNSDEMKAFIVYPNTKVLLIDKNQGIACVKFANAAGESIVRMFAFNELSNAQNQPTNVSTNDNDIKSILARIEKLENKNAKRSENKNETPNN